MRPEYADLSPAGIELFGIEHLSRFVRIEFVVYHSRFMQGTEKERWKVLAEQAAVEQDSVKLMELIKAIDELLARKQERLNRLAPNPEK